MMNARGKSDRPIVPTKLPNKAVEPAAEAVEGRGLAKGNLPEGDAFRTPRRGHAQSALERVRQAASACASPPKVGAGCGSSARPDLWRGPWVTMVPTPTILQAADCSPDYVARRDHTLEILAVLHRLPGLNKSATDIRATPFVQVVP